MTPIETFIHHNYSKTETLSPRFIIIHETANQNRGANARAHFNYWDKTPSAKSSAHFVVDDTEILHLVPLDRPAWHIGDGGAANPINNRNAIGIEICVNADGNYPRAVKNAIMLTRTLMRVCGIPAANVRRHYDVSGKHCPARMLDTPALWTSFKAALRPDPLVFLGDTPQTFATHLQDGTTYAPLRTLAQTLGKTVTWDAESGSVTVE